MSPPRRSETLGRHLEETRRPLHSLAAVAPLVLAHAALTWLFRPPVTAAAAAWVQAPFRLIGLSSGGAALVVAALFVLAGLVLSRRELRRGTTRFRIGLIPWIWFEGAVWGLLLHLFWNGLQRGVAPAPVELGPGDQMALALGAGIYEELVFRVAVFWIVRHGLEWTSRKPVTGGRRFGISLAAVSITSLLFALAHHFGPEPFTLEAFAFRTVAALLLTSLYAWRGLGVATCAHASYDLFVVAL